jgi:hypothetical protein
MFRNRRVTRSKVIANVLATVALVGLIHVIPGPSAAAAVEPAISRPLPHDYVEGFANGQVVAFHYLLTYYCATTPSTDADQPWGTGNGIRESEDPAEYQLPPCFLGDNGKGSVPPITPDGQPFANAHKLYGITPAFDSVVTEPGNVALSLYQPNNPAVSVQTQCARPGGKFTQVTDAEGTCLMHPSFLHTTLNRTEPIGTGPNGSYSKNVPDPLPLPQHSHVIEGTSWPDQWWTAVGVFVFDRSIWPDDDGNCPAGRDQCLTSVAAVKRAQSTGQALADTPSNIFFRFSVRPESPQPAGGTSVPSSKVSGTGTNRGGSVPGALLPRTSSVVGNVTAVPRLVRCVLRGLGIS